jgi:accessory colonization factor AcfC
MSLSRLALGMALGLAWVGSASAAETLHVYGPGGPLPAMKEAAQQFGKAHGIDVQAVGGPTGQWLGQAKADADVVFSGSEGMMSDFVTASGGAIDSASIVPLYLRPSAILVRPGNPKHITGLADLLKPGHRIIVVNGSGQAGLWEDVAGRLGNIASVRALRANIGDFAATSADANQSWMADKGYDAWLIWNIWQVANPTIADQVAIAPRYRIYRDSAFALTRSGETKPAARAFAAFLASKAGAGIFANWGWTVPGGK